MYIHTYIHVHTSTYAYITYIHVMYDKEFWRKNAYARKSVFELFFVDVSAKTLQVAPG